MVCTVMCVIGAHTLRQYPYRDYCDMDEHTLTRTLAHLCEPQVSLKNPKCEREGCDKVPSWGPKYGTARYCTAHKVS